MKSLLTTPLSSHFMWEFPLVLILFWLCLRPPMAYPLSTAVALGGVLFLFLFKKIPADSFSQMGLFWWLFLLYLLVSSAWSLVPGQSFQSAGFLFAGTLLYLMAFPNDDTQKKRLETWVLILALMAALWALYQFFWGFEQLKSTLPGLSEMDFQVVEKAILYRRPSGPFATSGALAALLILFIPQAVIQIRNSSGFKRLLFLMLTIILLAALGTTQSVGAWACLTVAVLFIFLARGSRAWTWVTLGLGALVILGVILARGTEQWGGASFGMRVLLWKSSWQLFLQHPLFGSGFGTFGEAYQQAGFSLTKGGARYAHNIIFQLLSETGLAGTGLFLAALFSFFRRFKIPSRWEGWGVMTGCLAFFLFSFLDLPFQMLEMVLIFAVLAARLELKPEKAIQLPAFSSAWVQWALLGILLGSGFFHPFRPWNLAMVGCGLWAATAFFQEKLEGLPLWVWGGGAYMVLRALLSPSALGAVWFLESAGFVLIFGLLLRGMPDPRRFLKWFCGLGLVWALQVWYFSVQFSDIKFWDIFPNPKQVGLFLLAFLFLQITQPLDLKKLGAEVGNLKKLFSFIFTAATLVCLKAFGAMVALAVGVVFWIKKQQRIWALVSACLFIALVLFFRSVSFHDLDKNSTQWDRLNIWKAAVQVWVRQPLEGVGPGAFAGLYHQVKSPRANGVSRYLMDAQYAHNEFLELLTSFGLVGLVWGLFILKKLWPRQKPGQQAALAALGTASLFDFCLHTPLIALQGAGLLALTEKKKGTPSWISAFLAGGLALGLFGSPALNPSLLEQSQKLQEAGKFPEALRCLETAEKLNAWDASYAVAKADYLEKLYRATGDPTWEKLSDEAFDRALNLEQTDGPIRVNKAERLIRRLSPQSPPADFQKVEAALGEAEKAMPFNAFVRDDEGRLYAAQGQNDKAIGCFQKAVELEPNFAGAWFRLGSLLKEGRNPIEAKKAFEKSLQVHDQWKDADRIADLEKKLVGLPSDEWGWLMQEIRQW